ncbi:tetratricopeptide repeat protein [Methanobrevibacter sp.]|uniref:tetratricopeptide repeat protein n=1 Tax=Methanobrevibacter sp. TaxID=66852 RepID=UPI00388EA649
MFHKNKMEKIEKNGFNYLENGKILKAKREYIKGLAIDPNNVFILNNLAQVYKMLNEKDKSKGYLERFVEECDRQSVGNDEQILIMKIYALADLKRDSQFNETVNLLVELYPENTFGLYQKSMILEKDKKPQEALKYINKILELDAHNIVALLAKGRNLVELKEYDKAEECYNLVFKIEPKNKAAINLKAKLFKTKNNQENTICAHDLMLKGVEFWEREDLKKADNFLNKALEMDSSFDEIWYCRGELFVRMGRINDAINSFNKAFEINPESGGIVKKKEFYKMLNAMKKVNTILGYEK